MRPCGNGPPERFARNKGRKAAIRRIMGERPLWVGQLVRVNQRMERRAAICCGGQVSELVGSNQTLRRKFLRIAISSHLGCFQGGNHMVCLLAPTSDRHGSMNAQRQWIRDASFQRCPCHPGDLERPGLAARRRTVETRFQGGWRQTDLGTSGAAQGCGKDASGSSGQTGRMTRV